MPAPFTRTLGRFVAGLTFDAVPGAAHSVIRTGFTDCVGVMLAGIGEDVSRIVLASLGTRGVSGEASLYLGNSFAGGPEAALANAVAGHALDYDDVALA